MAHLWKCTDYDLKGNEGLDYSTLIAYLYLMIGESVEGIGERLLSGTDSEYDQLTKENVATILSYGNHFMDTVCRDACDGHDVGRVGQKHYID